MILSRLRLVGHQERDICESERSTEQAKEGGPPRREESWAPKEGNSGYWGGYGGRAADTGGAGVRVRVRVRRSLRFSVRVRVRVRVRRSLRG